MMMMMIMMMMIIIIIIIISALIRAEIPSSNEPLCLSRDDGKRPDGLTLVPWHQDTAPHGTGRDCCPHAGCFLCGTKCGSGRKGSGDRCREKVCQVQRFVIESTSHIFIPVAVESLGPLADDAHRFISGRELAFTFANCCRNSVCRLSVCL